MSWIFLPPVWLWHVKLDGDVWTWRSRKNANHPNCYYIYISAGLDFSYDAALKQAEEIRRDMIKQNISYLWAKLSQCLQRKK